MRTVRTVADVREALRPRAPRGALDRARPDHGRPARRPPQPDPPRARRRRRRRRLALRQPDAVQRGRRPRRLPARRAARRARWPPRRGADLLFAPPVEEVYPPGFATTVRVAGLHRARSRATSAAPRHFEGVATVVAKLLNMVGPDVAYFGQKDAQQVAVIRRLVADLDLPGARSTSARPSASPTGSPCRAATSTCATTTASARSRCDAALDAAERAHRRGRARRRSSIAARRARRHGPARRRARVPRARRAPTTCARSSASTASVLVAVAARVGPTRLIDNTILGQEHPECPAPSRTSRSPTTPRGCP